MTYQITVPKIHCSGCVNLIKMSMEDVFDKVLVDQASKIVEFTSEKDLKEVESNLNRVFIELQESGYEYIDFKQKF